MQDLIKTLLDRGYAVELTKEPEGYVAMVDDHAAGVSTAVADSPREALMCAWPHEDMSMPEGEDPYTAEIRTARSDLEVRVRELETDLSALEEKVDVQEPLNLMVRVCASLVRQLWPDEETAEPAGEPAGM